MGACAWSCRRAGCRPCAASPAPRTSTGWTMSDVDVIVLDVDGGAMLRDCLASIAAQTLPPRRVIVFDNGSRTPTPNAVRSETNLGFAGGVNAALRHGDAPFVALVNNDVVLDPDWL